MRRLFEFKKHNEDKIVALVNIFKSRTVKTIYKRGCVCCWILLGCLDIVSF